jgi:hypothetical protein
MISAQSFEPDGFSPFAAGIRSREPIPALAVADWIPAVARYNTWREAEFRKAAGGAPVRRNRWNTKR